MQLISKKWINRHKVKGIPNALLEITGVKYLSMLSARRAKMAAQLFPNPNNRSTYL
jgi:hypothetical protein